MNSLQSAAQWIDRPQQIKSAMKLIRRITFNLLLTFFLSSDLFAQNGDDWYVIQTMNYIPQLDSLIKKNDQIVVGISEGEISKKILIRNKSKGKIGVEPQTQKIIGGWSKYTFQNRKGDTLYKIEYHDNLQKNFYLTFYYKNNQLVHSVLDYQEDGIGRTFYQRKELYKDGQLLVESKTQKPMKQPFKARAAISLFKKGNEYLKEFFSKEQ